ncbi:MAG: hypothetical protein QHH14_05765 [Clostridiales bacterium]|nr:hypothetical protein [Clostridiales bacterium]
MRRLLFWLLAVLITLASAVYQRLTGPTYPLRGKAAVAGEEIRFKLPRSHEITSDCAVAVKVADEKTSGRLEYKRYKTSDAWTEANMARENDRLVGYLPRQPMAGKLAYRVLLTSDTEEISLTGEDQVIIRFKGVAPVPLLVAHVILMFLAMLFSTRAGLAALDRKSHPRKLALWTIVLLFIGGFILGPVVQKYAFGAWWTGFPFGFDLTDNKTLIAMAGWVVALVAGRKGKPARGWVLLASVLMLVIFLIPHSLLGSELKYTE